LAESKQSRVSRIHEAVVWKPTLFNPSLRTPNVRVFAPDALELVDGRDRNVNCLAGLNRDGGYHSPRWGFDGEFERNSIVLGGDALHVADAGVQAQAGPQAMSAPIKTL